MNKLCLPSLPSCYFDYSDSRCCIGIVVDTTVLHKFSQAGQVISGGWMRGYPVDSYTRSVGTEGELPMEIMG